MTEFELIYRYFAGQQTATGYAEPLGVRLGIGDDCALLAPPPGKLLAVSLDTLVAGTHFPENARPGQIATRALATALSDLAAMGAEPLWFTLGLTLPQADEAWIAEFSQHLFAFANTHGCTLIGGDTTRGPLAVTVQVHGAVAPDSRMKRSDAQADDVIYVTGHLGDGAAALAFLQSRFAVGPKAAHYLTQRFYAPCPRWREAQSLAPHVHAAIDISDGLFADLGHICHASGLGARIDVNRLPLHPLWVDQADHDTAIAWALTGGDDYELCFTVPRTQVAAVEALIQHHQLTATAIGKMTESPGLYVFNHGKAMEWDLSGFQHF